MAREVWFYALCLLICVIIQGHVSNGKEWYVSRASGDDNWSCDQNKPCKSIWRAFTLVSRGDSIYLDGTNTENDPYTCQSGNPLHPGIYINKSFSLIGFGPMPPHIRCSEGESLTVDGRDSEQQMKITLSRLLLRESFVLFQDSSVIIDNCKFEGSERGIQFSVGTRMVSNIHIANSSFVKNKECISVVINSTKKSSDLNSQLQVIFEMKNSSFYNNTISAVKGSCLSFSESPDNNQSVSCNITLENVTFSHNKFSSKGLVFLELKNGNQNINLQEVLFMKNGQESDYDALTGHDHSELFLRSTTVNTFVNASNLTGQNARSFHISAANISVQIYNSRFRGHKVEGNGGVILINGTEVCELKVTNSSFVNTTATQGGALDIECVEVRFNLHGSQFSGNIATDGSGGAVLINATRVTVYLLNSYFTNSNVSLSENVDRGGTFSVGSNLRTKKLLDAFVRLTVERCRFLGCRSGHGGAVSVAYKQSLQIAMVINESHFVANHGSYGAALHVVPIATKEKLERNTSDMASQNITIEHSTFLQNEARNSSTLYLLGNFNLVVVDSIFEDNYGLRKMEPLGPPMGGGAIMLDSDTQESKPDRNAVLIANTTFTNCSAYFGGALFFYKYNLESKSENSVLIENTTFNSCFAHYGGAISFYSFTQESKSDNSVLIENSTFNNCLAEIGGAIFFATNAEVHVRVKIRNSPFTKNRVSKNGGAVWFSSVQDKQGPLECVKRHKKLDIENIDIIESQPSEPSWDNNGHLIFEDTVFDENEAELGGAAYIINGNVTFSNCHFIDNFASSFGSHIHSVESSATLKIQDSEFRQTKFIPFSTASASFINIESEGPVILQNTTLDARPYSDKITLLLVSNGKLLFIGQDNLTEFNCPMGSNLTMTNVTTTIRKRINSTCDVNIITPYVRFDCLACTGNTYSLQRGHAIEGQIAPGFKCLPCPFGGNCTQNIVAKANFWGLQGQENSPTLQFTMCPAGYCIPPNDSSFPKYNDCQGNRFGELCGHCRKGYSEALYSTHCRPSHQCNDYWFWPVALIYVSLMALYFTFKPPVVPWIKRQILWFKENTPEDQGNNFDKGYLKILFYFYQAANLLLVSSSSQYLIKTDLIEPIVGLFNFKVFPTGLICPFPGLTVVTKHLFSASHVFGILLMICAFFVLHWGIQKIRGQGVPSAGPYVGGILQTLLLGYTTLATVSFSLLRCVPIGSESRLFYDGNTVCFQWWQYVLIAFVCTFVTPFVFVLLWGSYKLYGGTLSVGKFLLACLFPLPSLIFWSSAFLDRVTDFAVGGHSVANQASRDSVERILYDSFKKPEDGSKLSLSWESIMIGRRLILVMLRTFVSDPLARLLVMNLFCVLFLLHHALVQPFRDRIANTVEAISLLSIVVLATENVFFASFLSLAVNEEHFSSTLKVFRGVEAAILCIVPAGFGLLVVAAILSQLCRLALVVCRVVCNLSWIGCRSEDDEDNALLDPVSSISSY